MSAPPAPASSDKPGYKILLAEDNDMNRELASRLLMRRGHQLVAVTDGQQAVERFQQEPFDAILMDLEMPVMDGLEATRRIRELEQKVGGAAPHMPIIAMTAYDEQEVGKSMQEAGFDGLITKPINTKELDATLRGIVEKVRARTAD